MLLATWVLPRSALGNRVFVAGGDPQAVRKSGVPVNRVKIILLVATAVCAALIV